MPYISIAIYAVPTEKKAEFIAHAEVVAPLFKKHGALAAVDCWGDDVPDGELTSLPMAVKLNDDETVAYSHIIWPDKASGEAGMDKAVAEMQSLGSMGPPPFDGKRMIFGSFDMVVEA